MLIQTRKQFESILDAAMKAKVIALDTETTGLHVHEGHRMIGLSLYFLMTDTYFISVYFPFRHKPKNLNLFTVSENLPEEWIQDLQPLLAREDVYWLFWHAKYDLGMIRAEGLRVNGKFFDGMVMAHMSNENGTHKLKAVAERRFGGNVREAERELRRLTRGKYNYQLTAPREMEAYACGDAKLTYWLWELLLEDLREQELLNLWPREEIFVRCLLDIEWRGILVNNELAHEILQVARGEMRQIEDELGFDPQKLDVLAHKLFASPPEGLGFRPGPLTKTPTSEFPRGRPQMDEAMLATLKHPLIDLVLRYRRLVKVVSTFVEPVLALQDKQGRIHPSYNTSEKKEKYGTVTSRLSCSRPNIQQWPRKTTASQARKLFVAPPGYQLWEFDYAQIELRLGAVYTKDPLLTAAFLNDEDPHQVLADKLGTTRQTAKHVYYVTLYGGGYDKLALTIEKLELHTTGRVIHYDRGEAEEILNSFHQLSPGFRRKSYECTRVAREQGYIKLWTGRRRHFDHPWECHKAFNSLLQGGAAEIVRESMNKLYVLGAKPYFMVGQIHDSIMFEIPLDREEECVHEITRVMEWPTEKFPVPFPVEGKVFGV